MVPYKFGNVLAEAMSIMKYVQLTNPGQDYYLEKRKKE